MKLRLFRFSILVYSIFCFATAFAQKSNVQNAFRALEKEKIDEAVEYIELAASNSSTSNDVKMYNYRGKIYYEIHSNENYKSMDDMAILKCTESYLALYNHPKAKKWFDKDELKTNLTKAGVGLFNKGIEFYNSKDYSSAKTMFNKIFDLFPYSKENLSKSNVTEESVWINLFYVSYAEKNNQDAKNYLQKLIDINYQDPQIYSYMSNIHLEEGNDELAMEVIKSGRDYFETDVNLIIAELNYYLSKEDFVKAEELLTLAVEEDPNNHQLFFALGSSYDNLNDFEKAEKAYLEAIDIKPDFYDALYNLGVMYYNKGGEMLNEANNIKDFKKYDVAKQKADNFMLKGLPYIEKCHELQSNDRNILLVLKELYYRNGNDVKYKEVTEKLK
ncbi:MAG: tetratricopeptide repeat protein [Flavobacteriales bacterium]